MFRTLTLSVVLCLGVLGVSAQVAPPAAEDLNSWFKPVMWRSIGPFRGGRSVAVTGVVGDSKTYYAGTTGGGLWKTGNMGLTWRNVSDGYFKTGSVGAVAVAESDPHVVYVGMGEHAPRGVMTHGGDGVYRSTDAGKTWTHIGLEQTQHISRIVVHPKNPDTVFVAAQGALYSPSSQRGVFKSTDGGATWEKLTEGLPKEMGKMAIAVSRSNPETVYALIESDSAKDERGLYVSTTAGKTWSQVTSEPRLIQRAWYYTELFIDPQDERTIYVLSAPALRSVDSGKTWQTLEGTHGDFHDMWINPDNPRNFIIANDGGGAITLGAGKSWSSQDTQPTAQFYRINVDNQFPYRIYGGQQDNTSVVIASREPGSGGITTASWKASAGGESAFLAFDPDNPRYVLGGSYQGTVEVIDTRATAGTNIMAAPIQYLGMDAKDMKYRFNWNAPIIWSRHEPDTFYHGAQFLLKTTDRGSTWKQVSPDLTRNEKEKQGTPGVPYTNEAVGAENYGTLAYVAESPHEKGVIWTGSDDGLVQLTRDGGATWTKIDRGIPANAFTRVVREDDVRRDLLFAGTELGVFASWNGGRDWLPFQLNLPNTPITDLRVHQGNLIAATSGRSFWILDDLALVRQYAPDAPAFVLYRPGHAHLVNGGSDLNNPEKDFTGAHPTRGVNPANGIVLYYRLPALEKTNEVTLEIADASGNTVRAFTSKKNEDFKKWDGGPSADPVLPASKGLNRFVWDMRHPTITGVPGVFIEGSYRGHKAIPGRYRFTLKVGGKTSETDAEILANPLYSTSAQAYVQYHTLMSGMEREVAAMHRLVNSLYDQQKQLEAVLAALPPGDEYASVTRDGEALLKKLKAWDDEMVQRRSRAYDDVENLPNRFTANYLFLINHAESDLPGVNQPSLDRLDQMNGEWAALKARADRLTAEEVPALNKKLWALGFGAIWKK